MKFKCLVVSILMLTTLFWGLDKLFPLPLPDNQMLAQVVVDRKGETLRSFADDKGIHRHIITLDEVPDIYIEALLAYEDRWFYYHPGVNPLAAVRAMGQVIRHQRVISGASTLTMQVARILSPHRRSWRGKLQQVFRALQLEWHYSKNEILTFYINYAPFGGNIEGIEAAARLYFNKSVADINLNEAHLLVVLPQRPSFYRPDRFPERAQAARNKVTQRMVQQGKLDKDLATRYQLDPVKAGRYRVATMAPLLARRLRSSHPDLAVIHTTIDGQLQGQLEQLVQRVRYHTPEKTSVAALIVDNSTSEVLAYKGSLDFYNDNRFGHVDMVTAVRSPGSTLKPFIYGLGLDKGLIHSESMLADIPTDFFGYRPRNLDGHFRGATSVSTALRMSLNIPPIQVLQHLTPKEFDEVLRSTGIELQHDKSNLSVGLGGTGTNLQSLVMLFRALTVDGMVEPLRFGVDSASVQATPLLSKEASWITHTMLASIPPYDRPANKLRRQIGWKTGTSYGYRDMWAVGSSPAYTVGVWVGRPDGSPMVGHLGATLAGPVMFDLFDLLPAEHKPLPKPDDVEIVEVCWPGGMAKQFTPLEKCQQLRQAMTIEGRTPPTLELLTGQVKNHQMPSSLHTWMKNKYQGMPQAQQHGHPVQISNLRSGQHFFRQQLNRLSLKSNYPFEEVRWYINGKLTTEPVLQFEKLPDEVNISACNRFSCDEVSITLH
ncbi:penicillin-binding protein 1C [Vibrio sp. WXL210]|uniref:penicillin-binding protein 1C n=1 Tax=Vibrio sp. WXL210 TaxID=3450709 RepID=UPI003EC629AC